MKNFFQFYKSQITFLLLLGMFSSCFLDKKPKLIIVNDIHEKILVNNIDPVTEKYGLTKLRELSLYKNDFEIRVWVDAVGADGFILRHFNNQWSAVSIKELDCRQVKNYKLGMTNLPAPKSGWQNTWRKLEETGVLDLPDYSELPGEGKLILDGIAYFVEINKNGTYRTYAYGSPQLQEWKEAKQMIKIGEIISDEFGLNNFKIGSLCVEK